MTAVEERTNELVTEVTDASQLVEAPTGTVITNRPGGAVWMKDHDEWRQLMGDSTIGRPRRSTEFNTEDAGFIRIIRMPQVGDFVRHQAQLLALPIGTRLETRSGANHYVKETVEMWRCAETDTEMVVASFTVREDFNRVTFIPGAGDGWAVGQQVAQADVANLPVGTIIGPSGGSRRYRTTGDSTLLFRVGDDARVRTVNLLWTRTTYVIYWLPEPTTSRWVIDQRIRGVEPDMPIGISVSLNRRAEDGSCWTKVGPDRWQYRSRLDRRLDTSTDHPDSSFATVTVYVVGLPGEEPETGHVLRVGESSEWPATTEAAAAVPDETEHILDLMRRARQTIDDLARDQGWDCVTNEAYARLGMRDQGEPVLFWQSCAEVGAEVEPHQALALPPGSIVIEVREQRTGYNLGDADHVKLIRITRDGDGRVVPILLGQDNLARFERYVGAQVSIDYRCRVVHIGSRQLESIPEYATGTEFIQALARMEETLRHRHGWCSAVTSALGGEGLTPDTYRPPRPAAPPLQVGESVSTETPDDRARLAVLPVGTVVQGDTDESHRVKLADGVWRNLVSHDENDITSHYCGEFTVRFIPEGTE